MVLFEIISQYEVLDIFKCMSRKQLVTFAISARCFAQLSASASIHSVHLVRDFHDVVKLAGSNKEEDKQMFLALQNALQYEETRKHYRIVGQIYQWKLPCNPHPPHPDELTFIRQCFPLMNAGLCIQIQNYEAEELEMASKLDFFLGACTEVNFDWGHYDEQQWHKLLTNPTVLAARKLTISQHDELSSNSADLLVNWLWQPFADNGNAGNEWGFGGRVESGRREMTLQFMYMDEFVENIAGMLKQKFEYSLDKNAMPLPNFLLRIIHNDCFNPVRQFSIEPIQKMVDSGKNVVAKLEFINCPVENPSVIANLKREIRQFYGQMEKEEEINQQKKRQKTDGPVILLIDDDEEIDSSNSEFVDEEEVEENMEEEIEDNGNKQQQ